MSATESDSTAQNIIGMEDMALRRWLNGDPGGFLEISADDVVYFDPFIERRLDGLPALRRYYNGLKGKIFADRYEILNPLVQQVGDVAVLTFNFSSSVGNANPMRWNCTEVYRRTIGCWKIIQTHWSFTST